MALLLSHKRLAEIWSWPHLVGGALAFLVVVAWAFAVALQTGWSLLVDTVSREALQRFAAHSDKQDLWLQALAYPFAVIGAGFPLSLLALWTLRPSFYRLWDEPVRRLLVFFHCWTWPNLLFWTCAAQHNVRYSLPMAPGLAGLGIMVCVAWANGKLRWPVRRIPPITAFVAVLLTWGIVKVVYVEAVIPARTAARQARAIAAELSAAVPENEILYLCKLKDEGIMFYYGRPVRKLTQHRPCFAVLIESEWQERQQCGNVEALRWLRDQQGDPIVLVRLHPLME
jgi:hypothetical protein